MKHVAHRRLFVACTLLLAMVAIGCDRQTAASKLAAAKQAKLGPEDSFNRIMESFRRDVEEPQIGFVVSDGTTRSTMVGSNKVSFELVPPAAAADKYKAVITVTSQSRYSLRRPVEEADHDQKNGSNQGKSSRDGSSDKGTVVTETSPPAKPSSDSGPSGAKPSHSTEEIVSRLPDKEERKYELVYDAGRWLLVTKLNPDTEKSIQYAFDQALSRQ